MRHGHKWFIHLRAQRPRVGDEHPAYATGGAWLPLPLPLNSLWRKTYYSSKGSVKHFRLPHCNIHKMGLWTVLFQAYLSVG